MGLGLLAAAGPRSDGAGFGQRLQEGMGSFDAYKQNALKQKMLEAQMQQAMEQAAQQKAERARRQTIQQGMGQFFKPGQQALAPLMGDAATGIMPSAGKAAIAPSFDSAGASSFLAQNGEYEQALKLMPKPKELQVNKLDVKDFTPESVQKFAQTGSYADLVRMDKAHFGDSGGQLVAMNPFTGQPLNSINKTQSPDSKASNAVAWANNALSRDRLAFDKAGGADGAKPQLVDGQWVYRPDANHPQGRVVPVQGIADKPLNESQGAATNFGLRALRANEALTALKDQQPGAIKRTVQALGPTEGLEASLGTLTNWTQSKTQQKAEQLQNDFISAVLRKESGASISPVERYNAQKQYFPQPGDDKETILLKQRNRETAIEGLKMQAGPGAKNIRSSTGGANGDSSGGYSDPGKESRYQEWLRNNKG